MDKIKIISIWKDGCCVSFNFEKGNKTGSCDYYFYSNDDSVNISDYDEGQEEDIYSDIHEIITKNLSCELKVFWNGKEVD